MNLININLSQSKLFGKTKNNPKAVFSQSKKCVSFSGQPSSSLSITHANPPNKGIDSGLPLAFIAGNSLSRKKLFVPIPSVPKFSAMNSSPPLTQTSNAFLNKMAKEGLADSSLSSEDLKKEIDNIMGRDSDFKLPDIDIEQVKPEVKINEQERNLGALLPKVRSDKIGECKEKLKTMDYVNPKPIIIAVSGETASGKSTTIKKFINLLNQKLSKSLGGKDFATIIQHDNFYKDLTKEKKFEGKDKDYIVQHNDFDIPEALDTDLLIEKLDKLKNGEEVKLPEYHMGLMSRDEEKTPIKPTPLMFVEGLFPLVDKKIRDNKNVDYKVFIDCSDDVKKERWLKRAPDRGLTDETLSKKLVDGVIAKFKPYKKDVVECADVIFNNDDYSRSNNFLENLSDKFSNFIKDILSKESNELKKVA